MNKMIIDVSVLTQDYLNNYIKTKDMIIILLENGLKPNCNKEIENLCLQDFGIKEGYIGFDKNKLIAELNF